MPSSASVGSTFSISGAGFPPGLTATLRLTGPLGEEADLGQAIVDDDGGLSAQATVPTFPTGGGYRVQALSVDQQLLADAPFSILPALQLSLTPASGPPGTTIQYQVTSARPGLLRIVFAGVPVVYDVPINGPAATGQFVVPNPIGVAGAEINAPDATVQVEAMNLAIGRAVGKAVRPFNRQARPPNPNYTFQNVQFSATEPDFGQHFQITGKIVPPPMGSLSDFGLHVLFTAEDGKTLPIGTGFALQPNGAFQVGAIFPSHGTPLSL